MAYPTTGISCITVPGPPAVPVSPYGVAKLAGELYTRVAWPCYGLETVVLRYLNVFGPRQDPEGAYAAVIPKWIATMIRSEPVHINGDGETTRDNTMTATISARVIDVTMDGNMVIQGYREVKTNNETQHIILSGIIRPQDISSDNSVLSSYIADARIEYSGTGVLTDKQRPGWFARVFDVVWPF